MGGITSKRPERKAESKDDPRTLAEALERVRSTMATPRSTVTIKAPWCPACGTCGKKSLTTLRSRSNGDGSTTRPTRCNACGHRFDVIIECAPFAAA